jgi:hypothetical protein
MVAISTASGECKQHSIFPRGLNRNSYRISNLIISEAVDGGADRF